MNYTNKIVLVTGASAGIGKDIALSLINEGYTVYGGARRVENMQDLVAQGGHAIKLDITSEESIAAAIAQISETHGGIDILINNAGFGGFCALEEHSIADAKSIFEVNVFGLARLTQCVIPHMRQQKWGKIVNISSILGKVSMPFGGWYAASKFALEAYSDSLRLELKAFGIDVIIIEPGLIKSEFMDVSATSTQTSASGATGEYKKLYEASQRYSANMQSSASPARVISELVIKSIQSKNPKIRYVAGRGSGILLFMRKILSDKGLDKMFSKMQGK